MHMRGSFCNHGALSGSLANDGGLAYIATNSSGGGYGGGFGSTLTADGLIVQGPMLAAAEAVVQMSILLG
jgi:hypothetical protein